jgi:hypothetical protein
MMLFPFKSFKKYAIFNDFNVEQKRRRQKRVFKLYHEKNTHSINIENWIQQINAKRNDKNNPITPLLRETAY